MDSTWLVAMWVAYLLMVLFLILAVTASPAFYIPWAACGVVTIGCGVGALTS